MLMRVLPPVLLALLAVAGMPGLAAEEQTDDPELAKGRLLYRVHCQACHGKTGQGDGPMAGHLDLEPPNLTLIRQRNDGEFPENDLYELIDGRQDLPAHGTRQMPVWGYTFQTLGKDSNQEAEVRDRIVALLSYLKSIQIEAD